MDQKPRILHPTDFSPASELAFARALEAARMLHADLLLLHVVDPIAVFGAEAFAGRNPAARQLAESHARQGFDRLLSVAKKSGVDAMDMMAEGLPAEQIVAVAGAENVSVVVMGTHGRSGIRQALGSVAQHVVATAPCPVLTVRME
jgi:nucleotide-binding universal stress UspA family protein